MNKITWLFVLYFLFSGPMAGVAKPETGENLSVLPEKTTVSLENQTEFDQPADGKNTPAEDKTTKALPAELPADSRSSDLFWSGIKSAGALICVLAVIFAGTYLLKKTMPSRFGALGSQKMMQILESATLGDKRFLHLVKVRGSFILIGSTPAQVALIGTFPEKEEEVDQRSLDLKSQLLLTQEPSQKKKTHALFSLFKSGSERSASRENPNASFNEIMQRTVKGETPLASAKDKSHLNRLAAIRESLEAQ
jgi:flagellar biogenesis protein FliO